MKVSTPHACLIRKLRTVLADSPDEWKAFCAFHRSIKFDGSSFELLSDEELTILSRYADRSRQD